MLTPSRLVVLALLLPLLLPGASAVAAAPPPDHQAASPSHRGYQPPNDKTMKVMSTRSYRVNHDITIYADVKNRTKTWRTNVWATVTFYNKRGKRVGDGVTSPEQLYVRPGGHMAMKYYWTRVPRGYHHYRITLTSKRAKKSERPAGRLKVKIQDPWIDPDTGLQVPITVRNNNKRKVRHVAVYVTLFTKKGRIVATFTGYNYTDPSALRPGQTGSFVAEFGDRYKNATRVDAMVEAGIRR